MKNKMFLMDTNIASALWDDGNKYHQYAFDFVKSKGKDGFFTISVITFAELKWGLLSFPSKTNEHNRRRKTIEDNMKLLFPSVISIDKFVVAHYSRIRAALVNEYAPREFRQRIKKGIRMEDLRNEATSKLLGIQENDLWQASIAIENKCALVTEDKMDHISKVIDKDSEIELQIMKWRR